MATPQGQQWGEGHAALGVYGPKGASQGTIPRHNPKAQSQGAGTGWDTSAGHHQVPLWTALPISTKPKSRNAQTLEKRRFLRLIVPTVSPIKLLRLCNCLKVPL